MQNHIFAGIIIKLLCHKSVSVRQLAEEYQVSARTIMRYVDILSTEVPLYTKRGAGGGIFLTDNFCIDRLYFSHDELSRLMFSLQNSGMNFKDKIQKSTEEKMAALQNCNKGGFVLSSDSLYIDSLGWSSETSRDNSLAPLSKAIADKKITNIDYIDQNGKISNRDIEPHTLVFKENIWYIYAYCLWREEFRLFRLSRIQSTRISDAVFVRREIDLSAALKIKNVEEIVLRLEFDKNLLMDIEEWLGFKGISVSGGKYVIEAKTFSGLPLIKKILSFGDAVKVLEPDSLVTDIKQHLAKMSEKYV